ncbi:MAG: RNA methyltransferase [Oscillospiraceae bacterium]|nr:RNA methyltransferase [Oscillospiraceae bacterium]
MERITSSQNPLLRHIRKLQGSRAYREEQREFVADGFKLLEEAIKWYPKLKTVLVSEMQTLPALPDGVRCVEIPASLMQSLSDMKTPQGVLFTCEMPDWETAQVSTGMLLLDRIQDPGNLGTILRTADAFGVPVALTNGCADPYSEKTIRASMGAVFRTAPQRIDMERVLSGSVPIAVTALTPLAADIRDVDLRDYLVVIGSEGQGVCKELLQASQKQLIIPMQPRCESLNAAIAAAIVMWQMK